MFLKPGLDRLAYLIGIDEAGYGPNLGPLVIAGSGWRLPDALLHCDLYRELAGAVRQTSAEASRGGQIVVADSKQLYAPRTSLALLERGVLAAAVVASHSRPAMNPLQQLATVRRTLLTKTLQSNVVANRGEPVWESDDQIMLPVACDQQSLASAAELLHKQANQAEIKLEKLSAAVIQPAVFNQLTELHGNKAGFLSDVSLRLARELAVNSEENQVLICCDKHGGRNRYASFLQSVFGATLVTVVQESRAKSVYRFALNNRQIEIRFSARGESQLAVAWASMTAKYLRELAMNAFNAYWRRHLPGLRSTAGYPQDAKRFRADIAAMQRKLKISDHELWRNR